MIKVKPKKILFIGSDSELLSIWSKENQTEVISSFSYLSTLILRFVPDLIVVDNFSNVDLMEIRKFEKLHFVPIVIIYKSFSEFNNLSQFTNFSNVVICNQCVAVKTEFMLNAFLLAEGKTKMLSSKPSSTVKYAILFINKNFQKKLARSKIAEQLGVNEDYLERIFKKEMGISLWSYLTVLRLNEAKTKIIILGESVSFAASSCGFEDASYFSKAFKKEFGMSPLKIAR